MKIGLKEKRDRAAEKYAKIGDGVNNRGEAYTDYDSGKLDGFKKGFDYALRLLKTDLL